MNIKAQKNWNTSDSCMFDDTKKHVDKSGPETKISYQILFRSSTIISRMILWLD